MSLDNNRKIFLGSIMQALDKRLVVGEGDNQAVVLVTMIVEYIEYSMIQYNAGNIEYFDKIKVLNKMLHDLKYQCPDICIYKDRIIITKLNTAPTIEDNVIELPISNSHQVLPYNEVIKNYNDAENDLISQVIILNKETNNDLLIDNNPVIINNIYQPNIEFTTKYEHVSGNIFLIKNSDTDPCESSIISLDEDEYNTALETHNVVNINDGSGNTIFQTIVNEVESLPNDTIIYVHIDTSSMAPADQVTVKDVTLEWWTQFQIDNPDFQGSLLINTTPNSEISDDYATGRGGNGTLGISGSTITPGVEAWLENPAEGLLRQAWKEGLNTFPNEAAFQTYIQDKSIVVLTFVDESHAEYHGSSPVNFISNNIYQPTATYITDYNNYIFKVRPFLKFFKGVLYPISAPAQIGDSNFLLHSMAALEATTLTPAEIDALLGPDKVAAYGPTNMQTYFYDNLATGNPYTNLAGLKETGWEGRYNVTSPADEVLSSQEFADELNEILTNTENVNVSFVDTITVPSENLGNQLETDFQLKVRDNNPQQPLYSNDANIKVRFTSDCEETPNCQGITTQLTTGHKEVYTFTVADFTTDTNVDKVKIEDIDVPNGQLKYFNLTITPSNISLIIPITDIANGNLTYSPDSTFQEDYFIQIDYVLSFQGSINYCSNQNTIELTKLENPNKVPVVTVEDKNIELVLPTDTGTTTINATVNYTGTGGYYTFWARISGASDVQMLNPTDEDLQLANLKPGTYQFRLTVITIEDNFIVEAISTVIITVVEQLPQ